MTTTLRLEADPARLDTAESRQALARAAEILRAGGLVAMPTETVYGLGANALDADAVARIFAAKQRPSWDPLIVHIAGRPSSSPMLEPLIGEIPESARKLMSAFWPGPLTLLLPRSAAVPDAITAGRPLVGIRMPAHRVAFELIQLAGVPVAAPSANLFGHTSPTTAQHVLENLDGRIDAVVDSGPTRHGVESTVLDPTRRPMIIYRPGAITAEQISAVAGAVEIFKAGETADQEPRQSLPSPGAGVRHYAPRARLILFDVPLTELPLRLAEAAATRASDRIGLMLPVELAADSMGATEVFLWGRWSAPEELARNLYAGLHTLDRAGCTMILCPLPPEGGLGTAIRDRLRKAAG